MTTLEAVVLHANEAVFQRTVAFYVKELGFQVIRVDENEAQLAQVKSSNVNLIIQKTTTSHSVQATLRFGSAFISQIESHLKNPNVSWTRQEKGSFIEISSQDPIGNNIIISSKTNSVSSTIPVQEAFSTIERPIRLEPTPQKTRIAFLTSGGDSQGMNAAIRAIVRIAIAHNCEAYAAMEGYQGLVDGGDKLIRQSWSDVASILSLGGTVIGTARCMPFKERSGRRMAAKHLIQRGIDHLIVVGGDGSLTGADLFRREWTSLLEELVAAGDVDPILVQRHAHLSIVGMVGSIDNDLVGTEITIGANSSLHRIIEAVDSIASTAMSHQRAFVIEVMGRHCGWLALMASIACGADWLFIPERPPAGAWEDEMCSTLKRHKELGKRKVILIVAEGAIDAELQPITAEQIKNILSKRLSFDTRITTLGHVQRGGTPSAYDRVLATLQGVKAVEAVLEATPETPPYVICMNENKITCEPLMESVKNTLAVAEAIKSRDFDAAFQLRDPDFRAAYAIMKTMLLPDTERALSPTRASTRYRFAIVHVGAPAAGMNAATRAFVRYGLRRGHTILSIMNGFEGLLSDDVRVMQWMDVDGFVSRGGSELGTNRSQPGDDLGAVAFQFQKWEINGLLLVGGFEAFTALQQLTTARQNYPAFRIPLICLPATLSNNVPGTDFSLGSDTALNAVVEACDTIKQSASASRKRVFVLEIQGGNCGYLTTMAGLAAGASCTYIPEEGLTLADISRDVEHLKSRFHNDKRQGRLVLRNECTNTETFSTDVLTQIFTSEAGNVFDARSTILGHLQQGSSPSPLDRIRGTRLAVLCLDYLATWCDKVPYLECREKESASVLGILGAEVVTTPLEELVKESDMKLRRPKEQWWLSLRPLLKQLAKYGISNSL